MMKPLNNVLGLLNATLIRGVYFMISFLFIALSLSMPAQAQEKLEVKFVQVGEVKLAHYLKG